MSSLDLNRILRETFVVEVERHPELGSTNDRAMERAKQGVKRLPLLVIADRQTAGRGRGGNRWWTGADSLAFSLLLESTTIESKAAATPLISLAAGVAVVEAIKPLLQNKEIGIHWPNDVIAAGRKLAGILVEVLSDGRTIIGIGINTNDSMREAPADLLATATTLLELTGTRHDHTDMLVTLLNSLERRLVTLKQAPAELTAQADSLCLQRDKSLTLRLGRQTITGLCRGIAPDGALLLETSGGLRSFYSGTIITQK
jgi:BirA family transcriptional regulator, biotin operon repressor / biotin---[acetyl-CoA-carboxylase] ligase